MARKSKYTPGQRAALRKARQKKQEKYWEDRAQSRVLATDRQVDDIRKDSDRAYRDARDAIRREIDKFYRDFATAAGISEDEARQKLSRGELQDFKKELERKRKIIQEMIQKSPNNRKLQAYDTEFEKLSKVRELTRKEALEANVSAEIVKLGGKQEQQLNARSQNVVRTALWMNSADLSMLGDVDAKLGVGHPEQVKRAAKENWQHGDFSDKIWDDKEKLIREAREVIEGGFARNKGAYDMASDLMTRMNVSHSNALRLVRTEFNHLSNQAALAEYQAKGIKKYKFVSAIDSRTCDVCADLNGKVFNVADAKTGLNFPPMHPNCRSVTTPVIDWDDEDEWDYSGIELDDDELKKLGLTDEDVSAIDADTPMATDAPAPSLTVQQANQAIEDTQSVQRRAEVAERIQKQTQDLEVDVRKQMERLDTIDDDIKRLEDINKRLDAQDVPMTPPRAAIEAENLERIDIALKEKELEVLRLQERAAKLDSSVPKPDHGEQDRLADEIDTAKTKREERQKQDLSDAEIIAQALPKPKDALPVLKSAKDAEEPRTAIGKLWKRFKDGVERVREKVRERINSLMRRLPAQIASKTLIEDGTVLRKIDHVQEYKAIQQEMAQNEQFRDFILGHVETHGWDDAGHEYVPRLDVLKEAHRCYSEYLANGEFSKQIEFHFGHSNHEAFNMDCHTVFGDSDEMDRYQDAGGAFGVTKKGEWVLMVRSTITLDGLHHEIGHAIHERFLDAEEKKDPALTEAVNRVRKNTPNEFVPFGVDRQAKPIEPPKSGFELILLKTLSGKKQYKTIEEYNADANQYAGLVTAFHNINAIVHNDMGCGIHYGETSDTLDTQGWKELFANSTTILLSGNKEAIIFFGDYLGPIAQYVQNKLTQANWILE